MKVRATQAIMECLLEQEVDTVFGYPGGTILNLYDELYHYQDRIHHVLTAHEQGAAHAADGYARSTGKVGVCFATSGPGATNLTTGIATAYMDSSPVVFITCNVSEGLLGKDSFQEVDITGIAMPITKATYLVRDPQTIPDVMRQAFAVAATGRPGPVLIDFLKNVTFLNTMIDYEFIPWDQNRGTNSIRQLAVSHGLKAPEPDLGDIDTLVDMIAQSERPLLICGGGVVRGRADRQFRTFAEKLDAPVAITVMGGLFYYPVCEELGFVGAVIVILLFVLFLVQGLWLAFHAENRYCTLVGIGIMAQIAWQVFCNIAVVTNTLPNTGISLPFFSSGGTSLMMLLGEMGVVLGVSRGS